MSYEPTNWKDGDLVTSAKLNKIENGFSTIAPFIIEAVDDESLNLTTSVTYNDVMTALNQGRIVMLHVLGNQVYHYIHYFITGGYYDDEYWVVFSGTTQIRLCSDGADAPLTLDTTDFGANVV